MKKINKNRTEFIVSVIVLFIGLLFCAIGIFSVPVGVLDTSINILMGELLTFVGAVWQISYKANTKLAEIEKKYESNQKQDNEDEQ